MSAEARCRAAQYGLGGPALFRRRTARLRADYAAIAVMEYELLYIIPERGTLEDDAVQEAISAGRIKMHHLCGNCRRAFRPDEDWCPDYCPEYGNECSRPLPRDRFDCANHRARQAQGAA